MTANKLAALYMKIVAEELKLEGKVDEDGDVTFHSEDFGKMFFSVDDTDPEYMMLVFPNFADRKTLKMSTEQLMLAINRVNGDSKAAKLYVPEDEVDTTGDVWASVECFLAAEDQAPAESILRATIKRNISSLIDSALSLRAESEKIKPKFPFNLKP